MTRTTSAEAYRAAVSAGTVTKRHAQLLRIIADFGPMTANEAFAQLKVEQGGVFNHDSNTHARLTEMRDAGVLTEIGRRQCTVTGHRVIVWDVVQGPPVPRERKRTVREEVDDLRAEIEQLKAALAVMLEERGNQLELWR